MKNINECVQKIVYQEIKQVISDDMNLFENGLDSLGILRVLTYIEEELGIEIPDEELMSENLDTIDKLVNIVNKYV
ncbi:acyl carrier protein [Lacrimispora sp. AGF001]|uniref:acyl carrier protein n=1 Tax=Lacrimispora sp. AGF001 TaxID=3401631 RepID=UPI003B428507